MNTVSVREFSQRAAELARRAAEGEVFIITRAGRPVVRLEPITGRRTGGITPTSPTSPTGFGIPSGKPIDQTIRDPRGD